ncbi:dipeptidase [Pinibacter aurantiacus]|uniref:Membrane dipeptidase n=1 Tax=Pinibacter aurantiacus TaxID=2851599 RepID=A0A9E2W646_9BACT|nr:membrane dipeptidase [Pinibacter aurantiacus]MBV4359403.1 membrane dipeptidase [Pinibacter aurantiacus]
MNRNEWSRRKFITSISGTGAAVMLNPLWSWALNDQDSRVAKIVASTIGIDTHNHIDVPLDNAELPGPALDLAGELKTSGLSAIVMTFATDYKRNIQPGEAYQRFLNGLEAMDKVLKDDDMKRALNLADIKAAHKKKTPTVIQSIEGCHFLEGKVERVEEAYNRGLRHLGLLHDSDASMPLGDVYTNPPKFGGLTSLGADVIKECNRLGMLIDLAHASNDTINAALKITTKPVIISHTGLDSQLGKNEMMAKMMRPRLISKEQAKIVAEAGGIIGVWTHLADTPLEHAQNIRALVDVVGIDHVCIGTDTKLTPAYRSPNDFGGKPNNAPPPGNQDNKPGDNKQSDRKPNPQNGGKRIGERTNEAWADQKTGFYFTVVDALLKTGFTEQEIGKIGGGNYCRVFEGAHR